MRCFAFICLLVALAVLPDSQAAPVPKRTNAKPAVIDAGTEENIVWVVESVVFGAGLGVYENEKVATLEIVRRQKDRESWLKKNLRVERVKDTNLVHVGFQDGNAKEQAAIINAVVDYFLKNALRERRDIEGRSLERIRESFNALRRTGKITAQEVAKGAKAIKKREECVRTLPELVEYAKAP